MAQTQEYTKQAYLDEDPIKVPGCKYVLLSFVSPVSNVKSDKLGLKVRGVFDDMESARAHIRRLMELDPAFDIFVADCHRWLLIPPKPSDIDNVEYSDHTLQQLVQSHKEEQLKAKAAFETYKKELMEKGPNHLQEGLEKDVSRERNADENLNE